MRRIIRWPTRPPIETHQSKLHDDDSPVEEELIGNGLHAKLLYTRSGRQSRLWLGSANATMRAWSGRNVEVMARLRIEKQVEQGVRHCLAVHGRLSTHWSTMKLIRLPVNRNYLSRHELRWLPDGPCASRSRTSYRSSSKREQVVEPSSGSPGHPLEVGTLCGHCTAGRSMTVGSKSRLLHRWNTAISSAYGSAMASAACAGFNERPLIQSLVRSGSSSIRAYFGRSGFPALGRDNAG
jgi:hypothetical protein